jgi:thymidylate synthase ThyX
VSARELLDACERERLAPFVSDLDAPVFALLNLPETTRGALFARYSRYPGTLRRLMLDEFAAELPAAGDDTADGRFGGTATDEPSRSSRLYERVLAAYGDDSVAQLAGAHVACEWSSNLLTKILERPRLGAYLEQSTRYIRYDRPLPDGRFCYYRSERLGPDYERAMDALFATYGELMSPVLALVAERFPRGALTAAAHERAVRAKTLDLLRGVLPAASLSHVGVYASGQTFERLIMHLLADELPEARACGEGMLAAMRVALPSFVARVGRPDRGGRWIEFLRARTRTAQQILELLELDGGQERQAREKREQEPSVRLLAAHGSEQQLLAALLFEASPVAEEEVLARLQEMTLDQRARLIGELAGGRENRRHLPGRGFEAVSYRFEIVSDYGAFRDLQRHRMLTVQWQALTPHLGAEIPAELAGTAAERPLAEALERSRAAWQALIDAGESLHAPYALCMAYRIRYVLDLDAREAIHLIELRSAREGHASYRAIAREMHRQIAAVHPSVAAAMAYLDPSTEPRLERGAAESRSERRRAGRL